MSEPAGENGRITYTVKELLGKLDNKLDLIVAQLATKAEAHEVEDLQKRVTVLEAEAATESTLEEYRTQVEDQRKSDRRWALGFAVSTLLTVFALGIALLFNII
jgi:hypothetical protein